MEAPVDQRPSAWQPLTPRGVAAFADASLGRVLLVQFPVALLVAGAVAWFLSTGWFPTISSAVDHLPPEGAIKSGRMYWGGNSPQSLAESRFLAFAVDLNHTGQARSPSHVQVEFGLTDVRVYSLFGCLQVPYPQAYLIAFNFQELKPWWGAWEPIILALAVGGVALGLLIAWAALATLYCVPAWLLGLFLNRQLTVGGSWRLASAALMPGALVMTAAIGLYRLGGMDVIRLLAATVLHLVIGWVYLVLGTIAAPKLQSGPGLKTNPFASPPRIPDPAVGQPAKHESPNPFRPSRD